MLYGCSHVLARTAYPCKHFFTVFKYPEWGWNRLSKRHSKQHQKTELEVTETVEVDHPEIADVEIFQVQDTFC